MYGCRKMCIRDRPYNGVPKELKEFEGIRYAVTSNGGRIVEIGTGEALKEILIPQDKAEEILHIFENYDTIPELHCHGQSYLTIGQLPDCLLYTSRCV